VTVKVRDPKVQESGRKLSSRLAELRQKVRLHLGLTGVSQALVVIISVGFVSLLLDYFFRLSMPTRVVQALLFGGGLGWFINSRLYGRLIRPLADADLALTVERAYPELDCRLVSAIQFLDAEETRGDQIVDEVIKEADQLSNSLDFGVVLDWDKLKERLIQALVAIAFAGLITNYFTVLDLKQGEAGGQVSAVPIWFQRNVLLRNIAWPRSTRLRIQIKDYDPETHRLAVAAGSKVDIQIEAEGVIPRSVFISWETDDEELGDIARQLASGQGNFGKIGENNFRYSFKAVDSSFKMTVWGGDHTLEPIDVVVVRRPWVRKLNITPEYPKHTDRKNIPFDSGVGDLSIPEGTKLTIKGQSSKSLKKWDEQTPKEDQVSAWLTLRAPAEPTVKPWRVPMPVSDRKDFEVALIVSQTVIVSVDLLDKDGLNVESPPRLSFRAVEDKAPKVSIHTTGIGNMITPQATIPVRLRARDEYGLTKGNLSFRYKPGDPKAKEGKDSLVIEELGKGREAEVETTWDIEAIKLKPGTFLNFWCEAYDNDGLRNPKMGRSQVLSVRIVTREELMNDMIRRQQEQRREFEELIRVETTLFKDVVTGLPNKQVAFKQARKQLRVARKVSSISKELLQILEEMRNNKILEDKDLTRLHAKIVEPLGTLMNEDLPNSRRSLEEYGLKLESRDLKQRNEGELRDILTKMESIKNQMLRLETLTELITRLEGIIKDWDDVMGETKGKIGRE
jgi:hypothetical protein